MKDPNRNAQVSWQQGRNDIEASIREVPSIMRPTPALIREVPSIMRPTPTLSTQQTDESFGGPTLTIEHRTTASSSTSSTHKILGWMTKKTCAVGILLLLSSGGCAFFLSQWFRIPGLEDQINQLEGVTNQLQSQVQSLEEQNEALKLTNKQLNATAMRYTKLNEELHRNNMRLNHTVSSLETQLASLLAENDRYEQLNKDLTSVVTFLNETAKDMDGAFETLVDFVAQQIDVYRVLVIESLHNSYRQGIATWNCDFHDIFRATEFGKNWSKPIGAENYPVVMEYIDERLLTELCLDMDDLEDSLRERVGQDADSSLSTMITVNQLISGIHIYAEAAIDFYFPDIGDKAGGLTQQDWANAGYTCEGLPLDLRFRVNEGR